MIISISILGVEDGSKVVDVVTSAVVAVVAAIVVVSAIPVAVGSGKNSVKIQ